ncbi:MAG: hypothetical protein ACREQ5_32955 [Candidatus Dormibacteria bacterium]
MSLTVQVPDELARRLEAVAETRHLTAEQAALEAIEAQLPARRRLSFSAIGTSGQTRGGAHADELIAEHFAGKTAREV